MAAKIVVGTFDTRARAENALMRLRDAGISPDLVSVVMSQDARVREFGEPTVGAAEGAGVGGVWGGLLGAFAGGLVAVGAVALPGLGIVAVGPIVAALAGAGAGGAAGTLLGSLIGLGVGESDAAAAQAAIARGHIILAAHVESRDTATRVTQVFRSFGGTDVHTNAR